MSSPPLIVRLHDQAAVRLPRRLTPAPGPDPAPASGPPAGLACANWSSCRGQHRSLRQASRRWPSHDDTSSPPTHLWPATGDSQSRHIPCPLRSLHAKRSRAEPVRVLRPRTQSPRLAWLQRSKLALIQRSVPTYTRFPKIGLVCDCSSHFILALVPDTGPGPDILHLNEALDQALDNVGIDTLAADAGYDSEASHEYARSERHVRSLIPALIGRPTEKRPSGYWRGQMKARLHLTRYGQRWQAETVNSMLKRLLGSELRARTIGVSAERCYSWPLLST
jgi:hypothetical protein